MVKKETAAKRKNRRKRKKGETVEHHQLRLAADDLKEIKDFVENEFDSHEVGAEKRTQSIITSINSVVSLINSVVSQGQAQQQRVVEEIKGSTKSGMSVEKPDKTEKLLIFVLGLVVGMAFPELADAILKIISGGQ